MDLFDKNHEDFEKSFKIMFDLSPDGFLIADKTGKIEYLSESGKRMFGLTQEDIESGITLFQFVHDDDKERALKNNRERAEGKYSGFSEYRVIRKDGSSFWNETNATFIKDANNNITSLFVVFRDITERKEQESILHKYTNNLKELNNLKDRLFSIIAHDLRNPFNGLISFSDLLIDQIEKNNPERVLRYASIIKEISISGYHLLTNLLDWAKLQTGKISVCYFPVSFTEIIENELLLIRPLMAEKQINVSITYRDDIKIISDKDILSTILRNIITNAVKFTKNEGSVTIETYIKDDFYNISIQDTGIGFNEEKLKNLYSIDEMRSSRGTNNEIGTGLGLILCKDLMELLNGKMSLDSKEGVGSKFVISLREPDIKLL